MTDDKAARLRGDTPGALMARLVDLVMAAKEIVPQGDFRELRWHQMANKALEQIKDLAKGKASKEARLLWKWDDLDHDGTVKSIKAVPQSGEFWIVESKSDSLPLSPLDICQVIDHDFVFMIGVQFPVDISTLMFHRKLDLTKTES